MEKIRPGKTGMMVTRLGFGGISIQRYTDDDAMKVIMRCLVLGLNFIDTANGYTTSEERIGRAIKGRRQDVFIATKTGATGVNCGHTLRESNAGVRPLFIFLTT